jgi:S-methylmethionine-dependent homocysteine/selenocysteine methylase
MPVTILSGPMGTELAARGVPTPRPGWSAHALELAPELVARIHRDYAAAGATVHVANTFRTKRRVFPDRWEALARRAVTLCRESIAPTHRVAGSIAPLEDCYRPDLSPPDPCPEHRELAGALADAGSDILLCETFPLVREALIAAEEAVATGVETWVSFTAGPSADLLTVPQVRRGALEAVRLGAAAVLVNCTPATRTLEYVRVLAEVGAATGAPFGAYANAGRPDEGLGWLPPGEAGDAAARRYADLAAAWVAEGATLIGSCCGTGPAHTAELARRFG